MSKTEFILASTSPRRIQLLEQIGIRARVQAPEADETPRRGEAPKKLVGRLALEKAKSVATTIVLNGSRPIIIAADTIVVTPDGKSILGKPQDAREAARMLKLLAGREHRVFTGYCIIEVKPQGKIKALVRVVESKVKMRRLTAAQIQSYISTGEPMDKAGSYAAQGIGMALIEGIRGSYANVVGLPVAQLAMDLEETFSYSTLKA